MGDNVRVNFINLPMTGGVAITEALTPHLADANCSLLLRRQRFTVTDNPPGERFFFALPWLHRRQFGEMRQQ